MGGMAEQCAVLNSLAYVYQSFGENESLRTTADMTGAEMMRSILCDSVCSVLLSERSGSSPRPIKCLSLHSGSCELVYTGVYEYMSRRS